MFLGSLALLPLYVIFWTSYVPLTDELPWRNVMTLNIAAIWLIVFMTLVYFQSHRSGNLMERLRIGGSILKGVLTVLFS